MDVQASKEKARALEKKGQTAKALALYREILKNLEGSKAILRELPLYVKTGDLYVKEGDSKAALAMYDKAGRLYAEHGSGKSVIAVCGKILKVLPEGIHTHLHYARLLIDEGHVREARKVLVNYAEMFSLAKVQHALAALEDRSDEEMQPMLEMVLEMAEWAEEDEVPSAASEVEGIAELEEQPEAGDEQDKDPTPLDTLDPVDMSADTPAPELAQPQTDTEQGGEEELEIARPMNEMLEERPVQRSSLVTGDIASEFERSSGETDESPSEDGGFIVKSGEGYDIEEASVPERDAAPDGKAPAEDHPAKESPTPTPEPSPASGPTPPQEVPDIDLSPPDLPEKLVTMESSQDPDVESLEVERFSEGPSESDIFGGTGSGRPSTPVPSSTPPRPAPVRRSGSARVSTPRPRPSGAQRRASASHRAQARRGRPQPKRKPGGVPTVVWALLAVAIGVALTRLVPLGGDGPQSTNTPAADSATDTSVAGAQGFRPPAEPTPRFDSTLRVPSPEVDSILDSIDVDAAAQVPRFDSAPPGAANPGDSTQVGLPTDSQPAGPGPLDVPLIVVEGLDVESVRALITPQRTGSRVVQILDSGERLTLTIFPIPQQLRPSILVGRITVTGNADGTSEGVVRFGNYEVRGQANISTELLEVLLGQLVERRSRE